MRIAYRGAVCSTIVLSSFPSPHHHHDFESYYSCLIRNFKKSYKDAMNKEYKGEQRFQRGYPNNLLECHFLDKYDVDQFAFIISTVIYPHKSHCEHFPARRDWPREAFEKFGFTVSKPEYNKKNSTHVMLVSMTAKNFVSELNKYNDQGELTLVQTMIKAVKPRKKRIDSFTVMDEIFLGGFGDIEDAA